MASNKKVVKRFLKTVREALSDPEDLAVVYLQNCPMPSHAVARAFGARKATLTLHYEDDTILEIEGYEDEGPFQPQAEIERGCATTKVSDR